jgi:hypothetical protein
VSAVRVSINDIVAVTLRIGRQPGRPVFGDITFTSDLVWSPRSNVEVVTDGDILLSGGRVDAAGTVLLQAGVSPAAVRPTQAGTDVSASMVSFASALGPTSLAIDLEGNTVDSQYTQLNVNGAVSAS